MYLAASLTTEEASVSRGLTVFLTCGPSASIGIDINPNYLKL